MTREQEASRFWAKVAKGQGCWLWTGTLGRRGYGVVIRAQKRIRAHRFAWTLEHGAIPDGLWVLHKCDNPRCVRPDHLFLGTHRDNVNDQVAKLRHMRGERNGRARFTEAQIQAIREAHAAGATQVALAKQYGTTQPRISAIVLRKLWRHVA